MMSPILSCCTALACATTLALFAAPAARAADEAPGTILLTADAKEGVTLVGKAKIGSVSGPGEDLSREGIRKKPVALLGTWSKPTQEASRAEFAPSLPADGHYDVYASWGIQFRNVSNPLRIRIEFDGGSQGFQSGSYSGYAWVYLGTYPFKAGTTGKVVADAEQTVGASGIYGVKFVPVTNPKTALADRPKVLPVLPGEPDEFDKMRLRIAERLTSNADSDLSDPVIRDKVHQTEAQRYLHWKSMQKTDGMVTLWPDLPIDQGKPIEKNEGGGWRLVHTYERVSGMAASYVGANAQLGYADKMRGNPELLADILFAVEWLYQNRYNERSKNKLGGEWIGMEITIPMHLSHTLLLLRQHVPDDVVQRHLKTMEAQSPGPDKFYGGFVSTGFNRLYGVHAFALRAVLAKDREAMTRINGLIEDEYAVNSRVEPTQRKGVQEKNAADGYYADGSFIQHADLPYIGIYGRGLIVVYAQLHSLLAGSPWEINDPRSHIFYDWVYRGYVPLFFGGEIMYGSLGRSTGQSWHQNGTVSTENMDAIAKLVPNAPPEHKARLSSILKRWLIDKETSAYPQFSRLAPHKLSLESAAILKSIKDDPSITPAPAPLGTTVFHNTDYVVHHQPDFAAHLRMFSTRIKTHEDINEGTNRLGWYQGSGALLIYNRDNSRYHDHFWATVDPYRLPGTTVDKRPRETPGSKNGQRSTSAWAGGTSLGTAGTASMALAEPETSLVAHKSWFFLGDQIVCLGSNITSNDNQHVETIVENAKLFGDAGHAFVVNGTAQPEAPAKTATTHAEASWAHLDNPVAGAATGWFFPGGAKVNTLREARTGKWQTSFIADADGVDHTRTFVTFWFDHGSNPQAAKYAYVILPGRSADQVRAYAQSPEIKILSNDVATHAVRHTRLGVTAANFWTEVGGTVGGIQSSGKAAVVVQHQAGTLRISASDPTQLGEKLVLTLDRNASRVIKADEDIKVTSLSPVTLEVNLQRSAGRSFVAEFAD